MRAGHVCKLGALTSFAVVYRIACPQCGVLFTPQILHHAREAGLPEDVWRPFTEPPPDDPRAEERQKRTMEGIQGIEEFIKASPIV